MNRVGHSFARGAVIARALSTVIVLSVSIARSRDDPWPPIGREQRPWAYHWWLGSAVDEENLRRELTRHRDAGLGGVHIIPIYGARGAEHRFVPYLSERWLQLFAFTVREADRLDLGVDLTMGTGWCFGGPSVPPEDGGLRWSVSEGQLKVSPTGLKVKRAAPGGEGLMINPFSPAAMRHYVGDWWERFTAAGGPMPRALYHDSFEYFGCTWARELPDAWRRRHGYGPEDVLDALAGTGPTDRVARVAADYRSTLSDLLIEEVFPLWTAEARARGVRTRLQAHGAAANLLDLYALADIPETEMFGRGGRDPLRSGLDDRFGEGDRDPLVSKFASSAAHLADRPLVAAETGTWVAEHFCETFEELRGLTDLLFASGVNHLFWHGCVYSPDDVPWPGWLFYASTQMNPRNPLWREAAALHAFLARTQSVLQQGQPDADLLLYWPVDDLFMTPPAAGRPIEPIRLGVHHRDWLNTQRAGKVARELWNAGVPFDYVSERLLARLRVAPDGTLTTAGGTRWCALVVPAGRFLPPRVGGRLLELAEGGATLLWETPLPEDVPGLSRIEARRAELAALRARIETAPELPSPVSRVSLRAIGRGRLLLGALDDLLEAAGVVRRRPGAAEGLFTVRRRLPDGRWLWFAWHGRDVLDRELDLPGPVAAARVLDPLTGEYGACSVRRDEAGRILFRARLEPGHSTIVRTWDRAEDAPASDPPWRWWAPGPVLAELHGWRVDFLAGGPELPVPFRCEGPPTFWTSRGDETADAFSGTALYRTVFTLQGLDAAAAAGSNAWTGTTARAVLLDLGDVRHVARVRLNGHDLGVRFQRPYRWVVPATLLHSDENRLEVEVTNLAANRIRDLDRRKVPWKNFYDINFVNIAYRPLDASAWPVQPSGLAGPVRVHVPAQDGPGPADSQPRLRP